MLVKKIFSFLFIILILSSCNVKEEVEKEEIQLDDSNMVVIDTVVNLYEKPDIYSKRINQLLFNKKVKVHKEDEKWYFIINEDGKRLYIESKSLYFDDVLNNESEHKYKIIVTDKAKMVYANEGSSIILREVVIGTLFYSNNSTLNNHIITLPDGLNGWIAKKGTIRLKVDEYIRTTSADDLSATAQRLKGTVYMENGISSFGIDVIGFIKICSFLNGLSYEKVISVNDGVFINHRRDELEAGDIIFFKKKTEEIEIIDIGIYIENSEFVHVDKRKGYVSISSLNETYYDERVFFVKRVLDQ